MRKDCKYPPWHLVYFRCAGRHDMILFRWHYYWIFSYLEGSFQVDSFMMDLWVYRDSIYIQIVGTHWHFNCYFTIVLDVVYGLRKGGHKYWWLLIPRSFVAQGVTNIICNVWNTGKITCQYRWAALTGDRPLCDRDQWREPAPFWGRPSGVIPHWGSAHTGAGCSTYRNGRVSRAALIRWHRPFASCRDWGLHKLLW